MQKTDSMTSLDLTTTSCLACDGKLPVLSTSEREALMTALHPDWQLLNSDTTITRKLTVKGYAKAVYLANLAAYLADREGHHPDVHFGWGYCEVSFTTHDAGGLSLNDFICAQKLDRLVAP